MAASDRDARAGSADDGAGWVEKLVDEPFLRASFAYGGELRLHFGEPVQYGSDRMKDRTHGAWVLSLRATPWVLTANGALLSRSLDEQQHALRHFAELEGERLIGSRLRRSDAAVTLRFENGSWFMALTEPRRLRKITELWELRTPGGFFVVARPDRTVTVEAPDAQALEVPGRSDV